MVMASVSGSVARNSVFFWLAKSATARPTLERNVPARKDDVLARQQLLGDAHRIARRRAVVAEDDLELAPAQHAALGVDLVLGQLHAVAVGHGERREAAVGVELADLHGLALRQRRQGRKSQSRHGEGRHHDPTPLHHIAVHDQLLRPPPPSGPRQSAGLLIRETNGPARSHQALWCRALLLTPCPGAGALAGKGDLAGDGRLRLLART